MSKAKKIVVYPHGCFLDLHVVLPLSTRAKGAYGYWMQSLDGGRSGYLQPGWLVAH
jgi:G:T-mismatch repair DNA endonuclease (very short patch repair protein)